MVFHTFSAFFSAIVGDFIFLLVGLISHDVLFLYSTQSSSAFVHQVSQKKSQLLHAWIQLFSYMGYFVTLISTAPFITTSPSRTLFRFSVVTSSKPSPFSTSCKIFAKTSSDFYLLTSSSLLWPLRPPAGGSCPDLHSARSPPRQTPQPTDDRCNVYDSRQIQQYPPVFEPPMFANKSFIFIEL